MDENQYELCGLSIAYKGYKKKGKHYKIKGKTIKTLFQHSSVQGNINDSLNWLESGLGYLCQAVITTCDYEYLWWGLKN